MQDQLESIILSNLLENDEYFRKVIPFLKPEYFSGPTRTILNIVNQHAEKYNVAPSKLEVKLAIAEDRKISEGELPALTDWLESDFKFEGGLQWLIDQTEKHCKDKAIYNAVMESIQIIDGRNKEMGPDALPSLLSKALQVGFDTNIGHDYIEDSDKRFEFYNRVEEKMPMGLGKFDLITDGGLAKKTLNVALAGTGVGKSLFMCHLAKNVIESGKNALYITLEMAEERIAERIDANLMDIPIQDLKTKFKNHSTFTHHIDNINAKVSGRLVIKEYPTASAHSGHFKALLNELKLKRNFTPDIIFIDYLNICASSRFRAGSGANSYTVIKGIAEELRGLAVEYAVPIVTATQTTRGGYNSSEVELTDTSESFGLPATADLMFALISTEEMQNAGHIMVKQLKNRYSDPTKEKRFTVGIDRAKMRLFDMDDPVVGLQDTGTDIPVFDNTRAGRRGGDFQGFKF